MTTLYPPATSTAMTWDRPDMEADYEMEAQVLQLTKPAVQVLAAH